MSTSLFGVGASVNVNASGTLVPQSFVGTAGQTLFTLTNFTYTPGTNSLLVFINGQKQTSGKDFAETSSSSFTLVEGVVIGDNVDVIGFPLLTLTAVTPGSVALGGTYTLQNYINDGPVNVKNYPYLAKGDGITDDTASILLAIATGRSVFFPKGIYQVSNDLLFTAQNGTATAGRKFSGEGMSDVYGNLTDGTIIRLTGTNNGFSCIDSLPICTFEDLSVIGGNTSGIGFKFTGTVVSTLFKNIVTYTGKQGVYMPVGVTFGASFSTTFINCHFSSFTEHGAEVAGGPGTNFIGCYAHNFPAAKAGYRVYSTAAFIGCNAVDNGSTAVIIGQYTGASLCGASDTVNTEGAGVFINCNWETFTTAGVEFRYAGTHVFVGGTLTGSGSYTASLIQNYAATSLGTITLNGVGLFASTATFAPITGAVWQASSFYPVGARVQNDTAPRKLYEVTTAGISAGAGGPTGTGVGIVDGAVTWKYIGQAALTRVARSELYVSSGGQSNFIVNNCPNLGTKPQADFTGTAIFNCGGSGALINMDGVNSTSGFSSLAVAGPLLLSGPAVIPAAVAGSSVTLGGTVAATVGAAGGATALPATPLGYIKAFVGGTAVKIPYYNN